MKLNEAQQQNLELLFGRWLASLCLPIPLPGVTETEFTGKVLLPRVQEWVRGLGKPFLLVRGNGGLPPLPLIFDGMSFYPDIEVSAQDERYLGVEVKLLRSAADASGSLSKALGQTCVYQALGIRSVHLVLLDIRPGYRSGDPTFPTFLSGVSGGGVGIHWFVTSSGQLTCRKA